VTQAEKVKNRVREFRLNKPGTEAQLVFADALWHFRSDGHAHWMKIAGGAELAGKIERFALDKKRRALFLWFKDGSRLVAKKTWLGPRVRAT